MRATLVEHVEQQMQLVESSLRTLQAATEQKERHLQESRRRSEDECMKQAMLADAVQHDLSNYRRYGKLAGSAPRHFLATDSSVGISRGEYRRRKAAGQ